MNIISWLFSISAICCMNEKSEAFSNPIPENLDKKHRLSSENHEGSDIYVDYLPTEEIIEEKIKEIPVQPNTPPEEIIEVGLTPPPPPIIQQVDANISNPIKNCLIEGRIGCFIPKSRRLQRIFTKVWPEYQAAFTYYLDQKWNIFGSASYTRRRGKTLGLGDKTTAEIFALSALFHYDYICTRYANAYLGAGLRYFFFTNRSCYDGEKNKISDEGLGGVLETGILFHINHYLDGTVYLGYSFKNKFFPSSIPGTKGTSLQIGGYHCGLGVGYRF